MTSRQPANSMEQSNDETLPLLRPMSQSSVGTLCIFAVASLLTASWCLMDSWNHDVGEQLFGLAEATPEADAAKKEVIDLKLRQFNAPLLLAFFQFVFMGFLFTALFFFLVPTARQDFAAIRHGGGTGTWSTLVVTHVFSTFWLQSLIMPKHPMSLGLFAASRSLEVPVAAFIRAKVFSTRMKRRDFATPVLMFVAAAILFYSYSQLHQCLCIWSGSGVELTGISFMIIYVLVLAIPASNYVAQESVMAHLEVKPLPLLAVMNLGASLVCLPILLLAHVAGWEDIGAAVAMIRNYPQVYMLIVWLCVQMSFSSALAASLIYTVNSFWAVSLRSLRVVFWWSRVLFIFYFTSGADLLSTSLPNESYWSFVMFCGLCFMVAAICAETRPGDTVAETLAASHKPPLGAAAKPTDPVAAAPPPVAPPTPAPGVP